MSLPDFNNLGDMNRWADLAVQAASSCNLPETLEFIMNAAIVSEKIRGQHPKETAALSVSVPDRLASILQERCPIQQLGSPRFTKN